MRTTLTIRDDLYDEVRRRAFEERRTIGEVMNELIASGLAQESATERHLGRFAGQIEIAADFDEPLADLERALDEAVDP